MRLSTQIRTSPALWAAIALLPCLVWYGANYSMEGDTWQAITARSGLVLGFINAVCGACAAWEGARLKSGGISLWAPARSPLRIAGFHLAPVALLGLAGILVSLVSFSHAGLSTPGRPDLLLLATDFVIVLAHIGVGYTVGSRVSRYLGAPIMLVVGYVWGFFPAAVEPAWIRHVNGQGTNDCCTVSQQVSLRSIAASAVFALALVALAALLLVLRRHRARVVAVVTVLVIGIGASATLALPLGFVGAEPRDKALLKCTGSRPEVCLWPEQQEYAANLSRWASQAADRLEAVGVLMPARVGFESVNPSREEALEVAATSMLPTDVPECATKPNSDYPGLDAEAPLRTWLALTVGVAPSAFSGRMPEEAVALAEQVRKTPVSAQKDWFAHNLRALKNCSVQPLLKAPAAAAEGAHS
ncbi:hypothetical protein [Streptomyces chattanoogensis]|uniref:DUF7224 domain-containing protein n=1 Tax=Streptomyces chattanoogensis TaxID=66876 RepID=UPI0036B5AEAF